MNILKTVNLKGYGKKFQGKVRDFYVYKENRIIITTDRQSAFDVNLGYIPHKGEVLNNLSAFWFENTNDIIANHFIAIPDPNVTIAKNAKMIPVEMIVRGYITGVTKTSIWYSYANNERNIYGINLPDGLRKNQRLEEPIITPTTHGGGKDGHDERLTKNEILKQKIVSKELYEEMEKSSLRLYKRGVEICSKKGLILVDTKYEFGIYNNKLILVDEIHTPDSSRFWIKDTYNKLFTSGEEPENFDKEFLRLWYKNKGYTGDGKPPEMPSSLQKKVSERYRSVYKMITSREVSILDKDLDMGLRIQNNLDNYFKNK